MLGGGRGALMGADGAGPGRKRCGRSMMGGGRGAEMGADGAGLEGNNVGGALWTELGSEGEMGVLPRRRWGETGGERGSEGGALEAEGIVSGKIRWARSGVDGA